ncbi:MAG TPA: ABC transporter ATP-binding protein [Desulfotomaculum sp.]|nr:MAG: peptide ABC transporter ATP-binding protein [Peptococcaceae bacterium BRH_c8a]KJS78760.1 MAG: peptide ABC transporter ATP-binding protein [Desulfotomaculum sp. BICA1-6]HBX24526.1 ABC transporter ATP-binding protein [Desulfotomaculum sp.]
MKNILEVKNLSTSFFTHAGEVKAVKDISFNVGIGEAIGIVGESGSGKSVTSLSIMNLLSFPGKVINGSVCFAGTELTNLKEKKMQLVRGNEIGMIFQDPMTSLNPVYTVGNQIMESLLRHQKLNRGEARKKAIEMLSLVGIPGPENRLNQYPHEFSGGMRQRVMIAMALCCKPKLLIADEPTTALDVTIQAQIIELLKDLKDKINTSIILITHDLGVVAELCSRVIVMYAGSVVEKGTTRDVFYNPRHPYTWGLLKSIPIVNADHKERLIPIDGQPPDLLNTPPGCPFCPRCDHAMQICAQTQPPLSQLGEQHLAACWLLHPGAPRVERGR